MNDATKVGTETREVRAPLRLRLRVPFERRVAALLDEMEQPSPFFTEVERANLAFARAQMSASPARALTGILCLVLQRAIGRFGEQADDQLFDWKDAIRDLLQEVLPEESDMEAKAYIADFKAEVAAATRLQQAMTDQHNQSLDGLEELRRRFNTESLRMDADSRTLRNRLTGVQASRSAMVDEITRYLLLEASARGQSVMRRLVDEAKQEGAMLDRSIDHERQRLALLTEALDVVKDIR